jgi:topoisomerase-4 subunit A
MFVGKNVLYLYVFRRNDNRTIYNVVYRHGKHGPDYIKRFAVTGITLDKEYDVTQGKEGSRIVYFSANPNGEAETIRVILKPKPRQKILVFEKDFSDIAIKGRQSMGNILTKAEVHKISLKQKGGSTLGGRKVWFDQDVLRLNYDGRGKFLGEFQSDDQILIVNQNGEFYTSNFDVTNHYEAGIIRIEKFDANKIWTAVLFDADQQFMYLKRFVFESSAKKQNFLGENHESKLHILTDIVYPRIQVTFGGRDSYREALEIDADEFIAVKGFKAKGKRLSTFEIGNIKELEPIRFPEVVEEEEKKFEVQIDDDDDEIDNRPISDIIDEITGQQSLFKDGDKEGEE